MKITRSRHSIVLKGAQWHKHARPTNGHRTPWHCNNHTDTTHKCPMVNSNSIYVPIWIWMASKPFHHIISINDKNTFPSYSFYFPINFHNTSCAFFDGVWIQTLKRDHCSNSFLLSRSTFHVPISIITYSMTSLCVINSIDQCAIHSESNMNWW